MTYTVKWVYQPVALRTGSQRGQGLQNRESENSKLKKLLAEKLLVVEAMKDMLSKSGEACQEEVVRGQAGSHFHLSERAASNLVRPSRTAYQY